MKKLWLNGNGSSKILEMKQEIIKYLACLFVAFGIVSCNNEPKPLKVLDEDPSQLTELGISVPMITFSGDVTSRANESSSNVDQDGWMSNLYLAAIKTAQVTVNEDGKYEFQELPEANQPFNIYELDTSGYNPQVGVDKKPSVFYINLYPGKYKFYLIANFDRYLARFSYVADVLSEDELKDLVLNFSTDIALRPSHLPMAAFPEDFSGDNFENNIVTIFPKNSGSNGSSSDAGRLTINANLHFLCSKVRYTILYNNTPGGCSERFGNNSIRFIVNQTSDRPKVKNVRRQVRVFTEKLSSRFTPDDLYISNVPKDSEAYPDGYWTLDLGRYEFPENGENYPESASDNLIPWTDSPNLAKWKSSHQRVWQGVVYLPENDLKTEKSSLEGLLSNYNSNTSDGEKLKLSGLDKYTTLVFPYVIEKYNDGNGNYQDAVINEDTMFDEKTFSLFNDESQIHYGSSSNYPDDPNYDNKLENGYSEGLKRGFFYDVVAKVVNPNEEPELFIQVFIGDHPWLYHNNGKQEW